MGDGAQVQSTAEVVVMTSPYRGASVRTPNFVAYSANCQLCNPNPLGDSSSTIATQGP